MGLGLAGGATSFLPPVLLMASLAALAEIGEAPVPEPGDPPELIITMAPLIETPAGPRFASVDDLMADLHAGR